MSRGMDDAAAFCDGRIPLLFPRAFDADRFARRDTAKYPSLGEDLRPAHTHDADQPPSRSKRRSQAAKRMSLFSMADNADDAPMRLDNDGSLRRIESPQ